MSGFRLIVLLALCWQAVAQDTRLAALRTSLVGMRGRPAGFNKVRGATPELTVAKHLLRDWVESRLGALTLRGDEGELMRRLNEELREAGLFCGEAREPEQPACPNWIYLGFIDDVKLWRQDGFLIVKTAFGIECGFDESAYVYTWSEKGWRRVWQTEQDTYTEKEYKPQTIHAVLVSGYSATNDYLALTLGSRPWCSSAWHPVYYRVFRLGPDLDSPPLLNGEEFGFLANDPPILGSVGRGDLLVEFTKSSIDAGVHSRPAIRHYTLDRDRVSRIDPVALRPRDFVDEWLTNAWKDARFWSEEGNGRSLLEWHRKLHKDHVSGEFVYPTMHCPRTPDLWQVGVDFSHPATPTGAEPRAPVYFLVRWRPPYTFRMVQVSSRPSSACTEEDREADNAVRTLFPVQEWR